MLTDTDLDEMEGLAGRLRDEADEERDHALMQDFWHEGSLREAADALTTLIAAAREGVRLREAILAVVAATRAYLPPDGIDAQECLNRVLAATDNPEINPIIRSLENGH